MPTSGFRRLPALATAVGCALMVVACGSSSPIATTSARIDRAQGIQFAGCMRSHGVPNYPDPTYRNGRPTSQPLTVYGINPDSPAVQSAQRVCGGK